MSEHIKDWYQDRIDKGEMGPNGWTREHSQMLRFMLTMQAIELLFSSGLTVLDYGCGTGDFLEYLRESKGMNLTGYTGLEIRKDAREAFKFRFGHLGNAEVFESADEIPEHRKFDVIVSNAAFGFAEQNPVTELGNLAEKYDARMIVADFFSTRRPYEPNMDGYHAYDPFDLLKDFLARMGWHRFALNHESFPHVFSLAVYAGKSPWEEIEK